MAELREYQADAVRKILAHIQRGAKSVLLVAPTGAGKTKIVSETLRAGRHSAIAVAHRLELCKQLKSELARCGPARFNVFGVQSRGVGAAIQNGDHDVLFIDEVHHAAASSYRRLIENRGDMILIGATATPYRADGASLEHFFDAVVTTPSAKELSEAGFLAPVTYISSDDVDYKGIKLNKLREFEQADALRRVTVAVQAGDLVLSWSKYARSKNALIYGINLEHCERIAAELRRAKVPTGIISSRTSKRERESLISQFESRHLRALVNCEVFTEGTDISGVGAIIMLRPTNSRALYKQMIGRGMRPDTSCVVIDHVGNFIRHGNVLAEDPLNTMRRSGRLSTAHHSGDGQRLAELNVQRMDLHVEKVAAQMKSIWTPSVFR